MTVLEFSIVFTLLLATPWQMVWSLCSLNVPHYSEYAKNSHNITEYHFLIQHEQCCALRKIEGTPVLWICTIQGAQHMICLKKTKIVAQDQKLGAMGSANPNPNPNPSPKIFKYCNLEIAWNESLSKCTCKLMWMNSHTCKWPPLVGIYLACSKRSDSGERCEVKIAIKSRGGLSERLEQASVY